MQSLLVLMALDIASGLIAGYVTRSISSDVSWRGMAKKSLVLLLVAACGVLERVWKLEVPLASGVVGFYIVHELISIVENTARAGLPMPKTLMSALRKLRAQTEEGEKA
jgi:toxin secretion/phage lysis holin